MFCGKSEVDPLRFGENVQIIANQKEGMKDDKFCIENAELLLRMNVD